MIRIRSEQMNDLARSRPLDGPERWFRALRSAGVPATISEDRKIITSNRGAGHLDISGDTARWHGPAGSKVAFRTVGGRLQEFGHDGCPRLSLQCDAKGRLAEFRRGDDSPYLFEHDAAGRLAAVTYPDGSTTRIGYDRERLKSVTDRCGGTTRFTSAKDGRSTAVQDPLGRSVILEQDETGRGARLTFPDGSTSSSRYLLGAQRLESTRRDGTVVAKIHDDAGKLSRVIWPDGAATTYDWSGAGTLQCICHQGERIVVDYNERDQPVAETTASGTVRTTLDDDGRTVKVDDQFGGSTAYEYDEEGRLSRVYDWAGGVTRIEYQDGSVRSMVFANGVTREFSGDAELRGLSITRSRTGAALHETAWERDMCGRLVRLHERGRTARTVREMSYDAESRLVKELRNNVVATYDYDLKGNMIGRGGSRLVVGPCDELRAVDGREIAYDRMGQVTELPGPRGPCHLRYGPDGTLRRVALKGRTVDIRYDPLGRRIEKRVGAAVWRYGWLGEVLLWEEFHAAPGALPVRRDYLWLPGSDIPLAFREGGEIYYLGTDIRGAVTQVYDAAGDVAWEGIYDSFGGVTVNFARIRQPLRLLGHYEDEETGLYYNFTRYYCPWLCTYLSLDPCWYKLGATNYSYARNDPWNRVDPFGTIAPLLAAGLVVLAAGAVGAIVGGVISAGIAAFTHGNIWEAALVGAIEGFFTGVGAAIGGLVGGPVGFFIGSAAGGMVGAFLGCLTESALRGEELCLPCAARAALVSLGVDLALLGLGKIPGVKNLLKRVKDGLGEWLSTLMRRSLPQGISSAQFQQMSKVLTDKLKALGLDGQIGVHGSRAKGTARPDSDIDIAIVVDDATFDEQVRKAFGTPNPGSAKERTMQHAIDTGKIQTGEARLRREAEAIEAITGKDVQISIIKKGGQFDQPPYIPIE